MTRPLAEIRALVRETEVHRDVYTSAEVFDAEMRHVFGNAWVYVGHASQIPVMGDFTTTTIGTTPVVMVRQAQGAIGVLINRCPHKGTRVANEPCGNAGRFFRCPYHAWSFRLDGGIAAIPLPGGYDNTGFKESTAAQGMTAVRNVRVYRDFVFARLAENGVPFEDFFGDSLSSIDRLSPGGCCGISTSATTRC